MKKGHIVYLDEDFFKEWKKKCGEMSFSEWVRKQMAAAIFGADSVIEMEEKKMDSLKKQLKDGEKIVEKISSINHQKKVLNKRLLRKSNDLRERLKEWFSLHVRAMNEKNRSLLVEANVLRDGLCRELDVSYSELFRLAERGGIERNR